MPYSGPGDDKLPDAVQKLPKWQRELWVRVFNEEYDEDDEGAAFRAAWAAVRNAAESRKGIRRMVETLELPTDGKPASVFKTYKHPDGTTRWLGITSGGFEDRDGEVVSTAFLRSAVEHADDTGQRGPLLVYHIPGTQIGSVDFQAVIGDPGFLLESGTFDDSEAGRAAAGHLAKSLGQYGASIRFLYINRDDAGVYHPPGIILERSVLPADRAAFPWSSMDTVSEVKEMTVALDDEKRAELEKMLGEDTAAQVLARIDEGAEELKEAGIRWKEAVKDAPAPEAVAEPVEGEAVEADTDEDDEDDATEDAAVEEKAANTPAEMEIVLADESLAAIAEKAAGRFDEMMAPLVEGLNTLRAAFDAQAQEIAALKRADEDKVAEKVRNLPRATVRQVATYRPTEKEAEPVEQEEKPFMERGLSALYSK